MEPILSDNGRVQSDEETDDLYSSVSNTETAETKKDEERGVDDNDDDIAKGK